MIELRNVTLAHRGMPVLRNASLTIRPGETVLLTGRTGSGKTSLIRALYGDLRPAEGSILLNGTDLQTLPAGKLPALRRSMGIIFQDDRLLEDRSVYENVCFALSIRVKSRKEINRLALGALADIGLSHLRSKRPDQLSGGEAQRVGVVRALASNPSIILADEPTGDLDPKTTEEIFSFLGSRCSPETVMVIATHDMERAAQAFPNARQLYIENGELLGNQNAQPKLES